MNESDVFFEDTYLRKGGGSQPVPDDVVFACAYDLHCISDNTEEAAFFRRTPEADELWVVDSFTSEDVGGLADGTVVPSDLTKLDGTIAGKMLAVRSQGSRAEACRNLVELALRCYSGFYFARDFLGAGLVGESEFLAITRTIREEREERTEEAAEKETEIVRVARELGLSPEPAGTGSDHWNARCPETNHRLDISADNNSFGCGWCRCKGHAEELRAFVNERKEHARQREAEYRQNT